MAVGSWLMTFSILRWVMNSLIQFLFTTALQPLAKALVAALGPSLRELQKFNLKVTDLTTIASKVGELYAGKTPAYAPMGLLTADEQKDIVEAFHEALKALLVTYGLTLTDAQLGKVLEAVVARLQVKFPATV
jgi:hypothetical protein